MVDSRCLEHYSLGRTEGPSEKPVGTPHAAGHDRWLISSIYSETHGAKLVSELRKLSFPLSGLVCADQVIWLAIGISQDNSLGVTNSPSWFQPSDSRHHHYQSPSWAISIKPPFFLCIQAMRVGGVSLRTHGLGSFSHCTHFTMSLGPLPLCLVFRYK